MSTSDRYVLAATHARDAAYDLVLLAHVLAAVVGLGAVVLAGAYALALLRSGPESEAVRRYYRPGVNWAGRVLFLIPVLGLALMAMSQGDWSFADGWITIGLACGSSWRSWPRWPCGRPSGDCRRWWRRPPPRRRWPRRRPIRRPSPGPHGGPARGAGRAGRDGRGWCGPPDGRGR